ncbi:MAG: glycosyltransferase family 2 protein [Chloroflexi bacterium]|jgi:rhamnosyltransferase|nr:glycosyltransferase family 2 protein [Chloroflexota bacterium]
MSAAVPRVAVVIPTKNAGPTFAQTLDAIRRQQLGEPFQIVVMDSGSSDGTPELGEAQGARVLRIAPRRFGHGRTRNEAIALCHGEYVVLTVQDAIPADEHWLHALVATMDKHPSAAGAYSRQIPHEGASFIAEHMAHYWHRRQGGRVIQRIRNAIAFDALPLEAKQAACTFNNVSSIIRRSVWETYPFRNVAFAEDLAWGYDVLRAGYSLIYEPDSVIRHSHERPLWYEFRRAYVNARVVGEFFGVPATPLNGAHLRRMYRLWRRVEGRARAWAQQGDAETLVRAYRDPNKDRRWYRQHFTLQALSRIIGEQSPYPTGEQQNLLRLLDQREQTAKYTGQHQDARGETLFGTWPLSQRIKNAVEGAGASTLTPQDMDMIFDGFWEEFGHGYVRRAVLEEAQDGADEGFAALEVAIRQFADELIEAAIQADALTPQLLGNIWRYAAALVLGRRLGEANRYGAGGHWGKVAQWWLARNL